MDTKQKNRSGRPAPKSRSRRPGGAPERRKQSRDTSPRRQAPQKEAVKVSPDVVYLPPKPFSRHRLALRLLTVAAVVIALILGLSVFFKVDTVLVSGAEKYSAWDVQQASGIKSGDNLLTFSRARASGKIISALPYVKKARVGIKLPDTVNIEIVEVDVTYACAAQDQTWWLVSAEGKIIEQTDGQNAEKYTKILGVELQNPAAGEQAAAYQPAAPATGTDGETVPVTATAGDKLKASLEISGYLELNGIIGTAKSVNVDDLYGIEIWFGDKYQVKLGGIQDMSYKISRMKAALHQLREQGHESGILDMSDPAQDVYTPFT